MLRLSEAIPDRHQLFVAVGSNPKKDQTAELVLLEPDVEVNPVRPQVDVVGLAQVALSELLHLLAPIPGQALEGRSRNPRPAAEELRQRGDEVLGGDPPQMERRQHLSDLGRAPGPGRQDHADEATALAPLVHPRGANLQLAGRSLHLARLGHVVAHHQRLAVSARSQV